MAIQNKKFHEDIDAKTYNDKNQSTTTEAPPWNGP